MSNLTGQGLEVVELLTPTDCFTDILDRLNDNLRAIDDFLKQLRDQKLNRTQDTALDLKVEAFPSDSQDVVNLGFLSSYITRLDTLVPVGTILTFAGSLSALEQMPTWLPCDGRLVEKEAYPQLYEVIGDLYGTSAESSKFQLPDLRGMFLRGYDAGRNIDPQRILGSYQEDAFERHTHTGTTTKGGEHSHKAPDVNQAGFQNGSKTGGRKHGYDDTSWHHGHTHGLSINPAGKAEETRPKNIAVNFIIRALP